MRFRIRNTLLTAAVLLSVSSLKAAPYEVEVTSDVVYARAEGYWTELAVAKKEAGKVFSQGYMKSFRKRDLDLELDLYRPAGAEGGRPLILFIHGGAFYIGHKDEPAYVDFCNYFASKGYVCASIDYRLGYHMNRKDIDRAMSDAVRDARSAISFLVSHSDEYGVDPDRVFVAGSSAGGIVALRLAFMEDLRILSVASMWGGVTDLDMLGNAGSSIVTFHGDQDDIVPYAVGYPINNLGEGVAKLLYDRMYGSVCIDKKAAELGLRHRFYPFPGEGHALNVDGDKQPNANHLFIRERILEFFDEELCNSEK